VSFRFFHTVTRLGLSDDKTEVEEIDVARQFEVAGGHDQYRPLVATVDGGDCWCWPDEPDWSQLRGTEGAPQAGPNLLTELEQGGNPMRAPIETLHLGQDFDKVVLGISVGALKPLCGELMEHNEAFGRAIEAARTAPTQGFQLWLREDTQTLGWPHGVNSVAGAYVEPLDTFCDMSHLTDAEAWPAAAGVKGIGYFCGVMPRVEGETQAQATDRVKHAAQDFVKDSIAPIWPGAVDPSTGQLRNDLLVGSSPDRMDDQYYRANIAGTELYVLTPAGSVKDRIRSDTSGFANLVLAGDWTRNGIDGGCVEAAATSGRQAARALTGAETPIYGEDPTWLTHGSEPPFIEYGTLETSPGPFKCTGGRFLVLVVPADQARLQALLQRVLNAAAPDSTRYRPLGSHVVLMVGHIDSISSLAPGFDDRGFASEWQATLTVPAVAGVEAGGIFLPKRIVTFLPYLLVDNSISLTGGREIYGLAKALGQFPPSPPPADWRGHELAVKGFGGNFGAGEQAGWQDLLRVVPVDGGAPDAGPEWTSVEDVARHLVQWAGHEIGSDLARLGFRVPWEAVARTFVEAVPQVCLRQFRADDAPALASSRKVVEVHLQVDSLVGRRSPHGWKVDLSALDSHPIGPDLGVCAGEASLAFELEMDFVLR
jgi:hypothetical protein